MSSLDPQASQQASQQAPQPAAGPGAKRPLHAMPRDPTCASHTSRPTAGLHLDAARMRATAPLGFSSDQVPSPFLDSRVLEQKIAAREGR